MFELDGSAISSDMHLIIMSEESSGTCKDWKGKSFAISKGRSMLPKMFSMSKYKAQSASSDAVQFVRTSGYGR